MSLTRARASLTSPVEGTHFAGNVSVSPSGVLIPKANSILGC